ncbi:MAG: GNAT family N-acetyltransferase [Clostridia bacterium]|nr:GNAT family N-acetyltransferase [Clostridia bacterium]
MEITIVTEDSVQTAGYIHSAAWQASHRAFCSAEFIARHTPERQTGYLLDKMRKGAAVYLLTDGQPVGIVSVTENLIEDLYVLPPFQNRGYGSMLLNFAIERCVGTPVLWILNNNDGARRLYERRGFRATGRRHPLSDTLSEIEFILQTGEHI